MTTQTLAITNLVDELGELEQQLSQIDHLIKRRDEVKKLLSESCEGNEETTLQSKKFSVVFSRPTTNRTIEREHFGDYLNAVGLEGFMDSVKVSTTTASKLLTKTDQERLFTVTQGSRSVVV